MINLDKTDKNNQYEKEERKVPKIWTRAHEMGKSESA